MKTIQIEVQEGAYDAGAALAKFAGVVKLALADGWQVGVDLPPILASALADLAPAFVNLGKINDELAQNKVLFAKSLGLGLADLADVLAK